jgi:hypothetical protein
MRQMGICMEACGPSIRKWIKSTATGRSVFNYVEIGVATGQTFSAVCDQLRELFIPKWHAYGIDIEGGWSLEMDTINANIAEFKGNTTILLGGSIKELENWTVPIHFCLIDGCHEKGCCMADFNAVSKHIAQGGVVAFHDSGMREQGSSVQPHNGQPIGVRSALKDLGLLYRKLDGWKVLEDCNPEDNSGCFFTRKL